MIARTRIVNAIAGNKSDTPYSTVGAVSWPKSPIHAVENGTSDNQNRRCRFAQRIAPSTRSTVCIKW